MIRHDRMVDTFLDLVRLDSPSREEKPVADYLVHALTQLGAEVRVDDAGEKAGANVGNVIAAVAGTVDGPALMLSSHMDVVPPARGVTPIRESDRIRSDGTTVLGGDDKSGLAVILEVLRCLRERQIPHAPLEIAFTICEEIGLLGAKHLDYAQLRAAEAIVLDSADAQSLVTQGPSADRFTFTVHGLPAHAGTAPEQGISAVLVAARAIAAMPLGRIDAQSTSNVVIAESPQATNVVPAYCVVRGEARSLDDDRLDHIMREIRASFQAAAAEAVSGTGEQLHRAWIEESCERDYHALHIPADAAIVRSVLAAGQSVGAHIETVSIGGGSDSNIHNRHGIASVNLGTGMRDIHTLGEWLDLEDFYRCADIVLASVQRRAVRS